MIIIIIIRTSKNARPQDGTSWQFIRDSHDSNVYQIGDR